MRQIALHHMCVSFLSASVFPKFSRHDKYFQTAPSVFQTNAQNVKAYVFMSWKTKS